MTLIKPIVLLSAVAMLWGSSSCTKEEASTSPHSVVVNEVEPTTGFGKQFTNYTSVVSEGEFVDSELKDADYYIVYVSASW